MILPLVAILSHLVIEAWPALHWRLLWESPRNGMRDGGLWPALVGTLYLVGLSLVVATPVGGIPEVVDAESAVLVPPRDARALGDGIAAALARQWDTAALTRRFSRDWRSVAADTLRACEDARSSSRAQAH